MTDVPIADTRRGVLGIPGLKVIDAGSSQGESFREAISHVCEVDVQIFT